MPSAPSFRILLLTSAESLTSGLYRGVSIEQDLLARRMLRLFITGGIKGFIATLEIDKNPINAALSGFSSVQYLRKALERRTVSP